MLKKLTKWLGIALAALVLLVGALALYVEIDGIPRYGHAAPDLHVEVTPERVARGHKLASVLCASCHLEVTTARLTGKRLEDVPPEFGVIYSRNITRHPTRGIGAWTDGELAYLLRTGVRRDGQYVPPYMVKLPFLSDEDLASVIAFLRSDDPWVAPTEVEPPGTTRPSFLTKALSHGPFRPLPYPSHAIAAPTKSDRVAYGRYLVLALDCYSCHAPDFKVVDAADPEKTPGYFGGGNALRDTKGRTIPSANLTPDEETGIGRWSEADFVRAVRNGLTPSGRTLHYPMVAMPELDEDEVGAVYAYLRTVPRIRNDVPRVVDAVADDGDAGKRLYHRYGCVACHGEDGAGPVADLRRATEHYPTDDRLRAWLEDAPSMKPGTKMPAWRGIIAEADYAPLMVYVRSLSRSNGSRASNP